MCGRFYVEEEDNEEILRIVRRLDERFRGENKIKTGEIYPTNTVAVLSSEENKTTPKAMTWGFPGFKGSNVIINARSESAKDKRMFSESLLSRRVIIPSNGFYEWSHSGNKQKYLFKDPEEKTLYMGGLYQVFPDGERFVILTTAANSSMEEIHNRMPVIISKNNFEEFLFNYPSAEKLMNQPQKMLWREKVSSENKGSYEQLSFDFNAFL